MYRVVARDLAAPSLVPVQMQRDVPTQNPAAGVRSRIVGFAVARGTDDVVASVHERPVAALELVMLTPRARLPASLH